MRKFRITMWEDLHVPRGYLEEFERRFGKEAKDNHEEAIRRTRVKTVYGWFWMAIYVKLWARFWFDTVEIEELPRRKSKMRKRMTGRYIKHEVMTGETLSWISKRYYGDGVNWRELAKFNRLENPHLIHPGDIIIIPELSPRYRQIPDWYRKDKV